MPLFPRRLGMIRSSGRRRHSRSAESWRLLCSSDGSIASTAESSDWSAGTPAFSFDFPEQFDMSSGSCCQSYACVRWIDRRSTRMFSRFSVTDLRTFCDPHVQGLTRRHTQRAGCADGQWLPIIFDLSAHKSPHSVSAKMSFKASRGAGVYIACLGSTFVSPTRIETGSRIVCMVGTFSLVTRTATQLPSMNGSEAISKCSPHRITRLPAM